MAEKRGVIKMLHPTKQWDIFITEELPDADLEGGQRYFYCPTDTKLFAQLNNALQENPQGIIVEYDLKESRKLGKPKQACSVALVGPAPIIDGGTQRKKGVIKAEACRFDDGTCLIKGDNDGVANRLLILKKCQSKQVELLKIAVEKKPDGVEVSYELEASHIQGKPDIAVNLQVIDDMLTADDKLVASRRVKNLQDWAYFDSFPKAMASLCVFALKEGWSFKGVSSTSKANSILRSYFRTTFYKLQLERNDAEDRRKKDSSVTSGDTLKEGVLYSDDFSMAAFNTGLVTNRYKAIIAVFKALGPNDRVPYKFDGFCVYGETDDQGGISGKSVSEKIYSEPRRAKYFTQVSDCIYLNPSADVTMDWDHLYDNLERLPRNFVYKYCNVLVKHLQLPPQDEVTVGDLEKLGKFVKENGKNEMVAEIRIEMEGRIQQAIDIAKKRVEWNFKTAVPMWFPTNKTLQLLLPLVVADLTSNKPEVALVVEQKKFGDPDKPEYRYVGHTILSLDMAYNNARLVCRPDSDWLRSEEIEITEGAVSSEEE